MLRVLLAAQVLGHFMKSFETDREASSTKKAYSTMYITVLVQRQSGWFVSNVFLLIWLLLLYDWFSFLLPPVGNAARHLSVF